MMMMMMRVEADWTERGSDVKLRLATKHLGRRQMCDYRSSLLSFDISFKATSVMVDITAQIKREHLAHTTEGKQAKIVKQLKTYHQTQFGS